MTLIEKITEVIRAQWRRTVGYYDEPRYRAYSGKQPVNDDPEECWTPHDDLSNQPPHSLDTW